MAGISIEKRLRIDQDKLAKKIARREELQLQLRVVEAEIKILKDRIDYNTKKYHDRTATLYPDSGN